MAESAANAWCHRAHYLRQTEQAGVDKVHHDLHSRRMQPHVGMNLLQNLHHFCMFLFQLRALRHLSTHPRNPASTNLHWLSIFLASPSLMVYRPRPVAATLHAVTLLVILFLADDISDSQSLCVVPTLHPVSKTNSQICGSQRQQTRLLFDLDSDSEAGVSGGPW